MQAARAVAAQVGLVLLSEVQTDAGIWSREDGPGWSFLTWEQLEET